jgi:hypothetical protein
VTGYLVSILPAAASATVTIAGTTASISGLSSGTAYAFTVAAVNAAGIGPASAASNAVRPTEPPPVVTALSPSTGPSTGGTVVTLTGTGFVPGTPGSVVSIGGAAATVTGVVAGSITAVAPAHGAGPQPVTVTNPDGQSSTLPAAFTYVDPPPAPAPAIASVSPTSGPGLGGTSVTITGSGFSRPVSVVFGGVAAVVTRETATSVEVTAPPHAVGPVDVSVANPDGQIATLAAGFAFGLPVNPPPSLASASPSQGPATGGTTVTLVGTGFAAPVRVTLAGIDAAVVGVTATAVTVVTPPLPAGSLDVVLANGDAQVATLPGGFTATAVPVVPPPSVAQIAPSSGPAAGGTAVAVTGSGFDASATVTIDGLTAPVVSRTATTLSVTTPAHAAGVADVVVTNGSGLWATLPAAFTFVAPPVLSGASPSSGPTSGGTAVTLTGSGFVSGAGGSTVSFGGATATVVSGTSTTLVVTTPVHAAGTLSVTVSNPDGQASTLAAAFTFVDPPPAPSTPTVSAVSPSSGPVAGGTLVTVSGSHFVNGGVVSFGGVPGTVVGQVLANQLTVATPAALAAGTVDVTFLDPFTGGVGSLAAAFTYVAPPPTIDGLSVRGAPPAGGTTVNVVGTGLQPGVTATFGGAAATGAVLSDATPPRKLLTLTVPPKPAGAGEFVDLVVRNPDGQTATFAGFHYGPPPSITGVSAAPPATITTVHKGDVLTITGTDFSSGTGVQVQIGQLAVITSATATEIVVVAPKNNPGTYQVVVTNSDGQYGVSPSGLSVVYPGP